MEGKLSGNKPLNVGCDLKALVRCAALVRLPNLEGRGSAMVVALPF